MTIELLFAAIENKEQRSFAEKLYLDHRQLMLSIAYNILDNHDEAKDILMTMMAKFTDNVEYFSVETLLLSSERVSIVQKAMKRLKQTDTDILLMRALNHIPAKIVADLRRSAGENGV